MKLVLTCEHGGNNIPEEYTAIFNNKEALKSHRGYDLGALDVFNYLKPLAAYSNYSETSRLLIELNRSLHHKSLFSEFSNSLTSESKKKIIKDYYLTYRNTVAYEIKKLIKVSHVLHLSIHSFTPVLNHVVRHCDIGILYDPSKPNEKQIALKLKKAIHTINPKWLVRFNYPYLGKADGFTTYLRQQTEKNYSGLEIEINQQFSSKNKMNYQIKEDLYAAIEDIVNTVKV
ncbi:N-formylglutamate amidohydrolase [Lacinutrix sp. Hel_I_90]|uniref:N-formylglutamate amidohydrolase n=1 Tax=Lacinutrix sp. Hel_I_90 TaxID=1249999 RepID=UPI0005C90985|nr:N-formylglutamate amidohydrolase [Lacinutrix sp. Hel_I_90]